MAAFAATGHAVRPHGDECHRRHDGEGAWPGERSRRLIERAVGCHSRRRALPAVRARPRCQRPPCVLVVVAGIVAEMAGALGPLFKAQRNYAGPLGKSDRAFAFGLLAVLLGIGLVPSLWTTLYLAVLLVLSALTIVNRARRIVADAKGRAA